MAFLSREIPDYVLKKFHQISGLRPGVSFTAGLQKTGHPAPGGLGGPDGWGMSR